LSFKSFLSTDGAKNGRLPYRREHLVCTVGCQEEDNEQDILLPVTTRQTVPNPKEPAVAEQLKL